MIKESPKGKLFAGKCYKRPYATKAKAKIFSKKAYRGGKKAKYPYECPKCGCWHLSKLSNKKYKEKVQDFKLIKFLENDLGVSNGCA